jgi:RHS repeat-associated protein
MLAENKTGVPRFSPFSRSGPPDSRRRNGSGLNDVHDLVSKMQQATDPTGTYAFKYDPFGRRIQKSGPLGTTNYLYDGANDIEEVDNSGSVLAKYTQGKSVDEQLAELRSGTTSYYQQDGLGSVTALSNSAGAVAETYTYDSYGKPTASTGMLVNPFRYTGREFDSETDIYYYRARYYDPSSGRFLSEDPFRFAAGMNFFAYVHNNPVVLDDPMGLCDKDNCKLSISCGPTPRTGGFSHCTVTIQDGNTYTAYDAGASGSILWSQLRFAPPGRGIPPGPNSFVKNVPVRCDCAQNAANDINSSNLIYSAPIQNSNTAAAMMAADCGVNPSSWPSGAWGVTWPTTTPGPPPFY